MARERVRQNPKYYIPGTEPVGYGTADPFEEFLIQNPAPPSKPYIYLDQEDTCVLANHTSEKDTNVDHIIPESVLEYKFYRDVFTDKANGDLRKQSINLLTVCKECHYQIDKSQHGKMNACRDLHTGLLAAVDFAIYDYTRSYRFEYRDRQRLQFIDLFRSMDDRMPRQIDYIAQKIDRMKTKHRKWRDENFDREFGRIKEMFDSLKTAQDHIGQSLERWARGDFGLPAGRRYFQAA